MLLYKITYQLKAVRTDEDSEQAVGTITKWAGSSKDAGHIRKNARQRNGYLPNSVQTSKVNFPTKKNDIIIFLNNMSKR